MSTSIIAMMNYHGEQFYKYQEVRVCEEGERKRKKRREKERKKKKEVARRGSPSAGAS